MFPSDRGLTLRSAKVLSCRRVDGSPNRYSWKSEQQELLLAVPDILAGTVLRSVTNGDVQSALRELRRGVEAGNFRIMSGTDISIPPPPPDESNEQESE